MTSRSGNKSAEYNNTVKPVDDTENDYSRNESDLLKTTFWEDICDAIYDSRYISALALVIALYVGYSITIAPYQGISRPKLTAEQKSMEALKYTRPVLSAEKMENIYLSTLYAETLFEMPGPSYDTIKLRFHSEASKHGHFRPPDFFYEGVVYGLTWQNSHDLDYFRLDSSIQMLKESILSLDPKPTSIFHRSSRNNATGWIEDGIAVYFANTDIARQGMLSSDQSRPWKRTQDMILNVARDFKLAYIFQWFPHRFGAEDSDDPLKHVVIVQEIVPTRTGLDNIKSSATVWLSAINFTEPFRPPTIIKKEWTSDDHWSHYSVIN